MRGPLCYLIRLVTYYNLHAYLVAYAYGLQRLQYYSCAVFSALTRQKIYYQSNVNHRDLSLGLMLQLPLQY